MISIITPVYNGERFIESCIKSVIEQASVNLEHIIIDGNSTDKTVAIIKQYAEQYPHIRWISEKDKGQSDAMNKGIAIARGEILGILNCDDFYEPNVLNRISVIFKSLPKPSLLVGNCQVWDDDGNLKYLQKTGQLHLLDLLMAKQVHPVNPSAYFYHTCLHQKIGLYKVDEHYAMDLDFILRSVQAATVKYVDETWGNWRRIEGTKTVNDNNAGQMWSRKEQILRAYRQKLPLLQQCQVAILYRFYKNKAFFYRLSKKMVRTLFLRLS